MKERALHFFHKYERKFSVVALIFGFVVDNLTLTRIDLWLDNLVLIGYLTIATVSVIIIHLVESRVLRGKLFYYLGTLAPFPMQFAFGGLFSGLFVFYSRSAALIASWPFLLFLLIFLIGNEFFRSRYERLNFQMAVLFIGIFSYTVFAVPIIVGALGPWIFLVSGLASVGIVAALIYFLSLFIPARIRESRMTLTATIATIFTFMNAVYFLNIIPPIPLSLKEAGAYYKVERAHDGSYLLTTEPKRWSLFKVRNRLYLEEGEDAFFYSAVFAPTSISTNIIHHWQRYDKEQERWVSFARIPFVITGGRDGGYRGYTVKSDPLPGMWRVDVETGWGQILGRDTFTIITGNTPALLEITQK